MKTLHGMVRSEVSVKVDDFNATPMEHRGYDYVPGDGFYYRHRDSTFMVDPDGSVHIYRDRNEAAYHTYGRNAWLWVGDELGGSVFNTAHDEARPADSDPKHRVPVRHFPGPAPATPLNV